MKSMRILPLVLTASVLCAAAAQAAAISLNVKLGLWEVTSTGTTSGAPPVPAAALASLSPAQKAKIQAAMAAAMASANKPHTYKSCVTAESIQRGLNPDPQLANGCTQTVVSSSPTDMEVRIVCTGRHQMSGTVHFQASSPEAMSGTVDMALTEGGKVMKVSRQITSKWVSADCGTVKP